MCVWFYVLCSQTVCTKQIIEHVLNHATILIIIRWAKRRRSLTLWMSGQVVDTRLVCAKLDIIRQKGVSKALELPHSNCAIIIIACTKIECNVVYVPRMVKLVATVIFLENFLIHAVYLELKSTNSMGAKVIANLNMFTLPNKTRTQRFCVCQFCFIA